MGENWDDGMILELVLNLNECLPYKFGFEQINSDRLGGLPELRCHIEVEQRTPPFALSILC